MTCRNDKESSGLIGEPKKTAPQAVKALVTNCLLRLGGRQLDDTFVTLYA